MRYKNWKMYYTMAQPGAEGWILPLMPFHLTLVQNIKRDPFEQAVGINQQTAMSLGGAIGGPVTAYIYDWNMLPIGQQLWFKELESLQGIPAAAGSRDLQPQRNPRSDEEGGPPERLASSEQPDVTGGRSGNGAPAPVR